MEFFIALFGGIFLIYVLTKDKVGQKAADIRRSRFHELDDVIINHTETTIIRQQFVRDRWAAVESISDNLAYAFGENWREIFRNTPFTEKVIQRYSLQDLGFIDVWNAAFHIYLAKHGYRDHGELRYNPQRPIIGINPLDDFVHKESIECGYKVCHEIEKNIQALHGDAYKLYEDKFDKGRLVWGHFVDSCDIVNGPRPW